MSEYIGYPVCPLCGEHDFGDDWLYAICPVCGWENDPVQADDPQNDGGANGYSLEQGREWWRKHHTLIPYEEREKMRRNIKYTG